MARLAQRNLLPDSEKRVGAAASLTDALDPMGEPYHGFTSGFDGALRQVARDRSSKT